MNLLLRGAIDHAPVRDQAPLPPRQVTILNILEDPLFRLVLTFLSMGIWISIIVVATERWGGKLGGFLIGVPSTSAFSFFFTGLYVSPTVASASTDSFPVFMSLTGLMLLFFGFATHKSFFIGLAAAIAVWFFVSFIVVYSEFNNFELSLLGSLVISGVLYCMFRWWLRPELLGKAKPRHSWPLLLFRFAFAGSVVTASVVMGELGIPMLSAMFAAFPSLTISTLINIHMNKETGGIDKVRGMTMSITVSIMLMCIPYSIAVHYLYPSLGIIYGTIIAFAVAIAIGIPYYFYAEDYLVPSFISEERGIKVDETATEAR